MYLEAAFHVSRELWRAATQIWDWTRIHALPLRMTPVKSSAPDD